MCKRIFLLVLFLLSVAAFSQNNSYSRIKINTNEKGLQKLSKLGVAVDHGEVKKGIYFISDFSSHEIKIIRDSGIPFEILIDDVSTFYSKQNDDVSPQQNQSSSINICNNAVIKPSSHFHLGSYAGFFTYNELLATLDSMQLLYPNLISKKAAIDTTTTWQGRPLYWVKISNNPNVDENKPEIFYNALHHAREPVSISELIYYMWYLLDNYSVNPEVKGLVDNLEMYFVPCVNPDGYVYNQTAYPNGGGMQRKNMRTTGGSPQGVDLNRNYDQFWGFDDGGSSNDPSSDIYRGPSPGSEPETKMIKNFTLAHHFQFALSAHAFGNDLLYPWGYTNDKPAADMNTFANYAKFMTQENMYRQGNCYEMLFYLANGCTTDWFYGEQKLKNKIYEFLPEAGPYSFYPAKNEIIPICNDMFYINYKIAKLALKYEIVTDIESHYIRSKNGYFNYTYKSLVPDSLANFTIEIVPISPEIIAVGNPKSYSNTVINTIGADSIFYTLAPTIKEGTLLTYALKIHNSSFTHSDTVTKVYGNPIIAMDDKGTTINEWITSTGWDITSSTYHSPSSSITDSPNAMYANNAKTFITTKYSIDLTNSNEASLTCWCKWNIEKGFDYAQLSASIDNGQSWIPLCGKYTSMGSKYQDFDNPLYDGASDWVQEQINLSDFAGKNIHLRFSMTSDSQNVADGFYFDDILIEKMNVLTSSIDEKEKPTMMLTSNPNPANDYSYIAFQLSESSTKGELILYNPIGQIVYTEKIKAYTGTIKLETINWLPGIYYYVIKSDNQYSRTNKLCVVH